MPLPSLVTEQTEWTTSVGNEKAVGEVELLSSYCVEWELDSSQVELQVVFVLSPTTCALSLFPIIIKANETLFWILKCNSHSAKRVLVKLSVVRAQLDYILQQLNQCSIDDIKRNLTLTSIVPLSSNKKPPRVFRMS